MSDLVARYQQEWRELERLLETSQRSLSAMTPETLGRIDVLYRRATVQLARAATKSRDPQLVAYLNSLTARAHSLIYVSPRRSLLQGAIEFLAVGFPRCVARSLKLHLLSALLLFGAAVVAYFSTLGDWRAAYALSTPGDLRQPGSTPEQLQDILRHGRDSGHGDLFLFASFLFQNNYIVAVRAIASGLLAGVPTVLILVSNGLTLGHFAALHAQTPELWREMWAWILPHGIPELGAIVLAGGAGLRLGLALLRPGEHSRVVSLKRAGIEAGLTAIGLALMLFAAAVIESYVRQSRLSTNARLNFAAVSAVLWGLYFANGWRCERRARRSLTREVA